MSKHLSLELEEIVNAVAPEYRSAPAPDASVHALERWLEAQGLRLPPEYRELLLISDGLQIDNDNVYSAEDCRWQTEELREDHDARYIAIGREGNVTCWVFDIDQAEYVVSSFSDPDEVIETFTDLKSLLTSRLFSSGLIAWR